MPSHHWVVLHHSEKDSRSKGYPLQTKEDIHPTSGFGPTKSICFFIPFSWEFDIIRHYFKKMVFVIKKPLPLCPKAKTSNYTTYYSTFSLLVKI